MLENPRLQRLRLRLLHRFRTNFLAARDGECEDWKKLQVAASRPETFDAGYDCGRCGKGSELSARIKRAFSASGRGWQQTWAFSLGWYHAGLWH